MSSLFIVTSAIHTKFGVYSVEDRLNQTIASLQSIKDKCNADIVVLDGGENSLSEEEKEKLKPYTNSIVEFCNDPLVKEIQQIQDDWDVVKKNFY
jgi:hypothetical protein